MGLISGLGRSPGGGNDNPFQHSCWENPMDKGAGTCYSPQSCKESDVTEHVWKTVKTMTLSCIGVKLINNVVIVSGEEQKDSVIHIYVSILCQISLLHNVE